MSAHDDVRSDPIAGEGKHPHRPIRRPDWARPGGLLMAILKCEECGTEWTCMPNIPMHCPECLNQQPEDTTRPDASDLGFGQCECQTCIGSLRPASDDTFTGEFFGP